MTHAVLLGDPTHFRIKAGANTYTRNKWGFRKKVNQKKALAQWLVLKELLESLGVKAFVLPSNPNYPGLVFPANAGFLFPKYEALPYSQKIFYLSALTKHRAGEQAIYRDFLGSLGFQFRTLSLPFEGEADFFSCGEDYIFSYGDIVSTGFRPKWGWPPFAYRFSHRTDQRNLATLQGVVGDKRIIEIKLVDPRYYHGDTALFAFGSSREYLFAYLDSMGGESQSRLKTKLGKRLFPLSRDDAENFVANSFQVDTDQGPHLVLPEKTSDKVKSTLKTLDIPFSTIEVSEFYEKGGGSIKCLLCDLGPY